MEDRPDWAFGVFTAEAIEAKRKYYMSLRTEADRIAEQKCLKREEAMLNRPRPVSPHAEPERNQAIWKERKEQGTTFRELGEKHGLSPGRVREIVIGMDRRIERRAFFDELRKQKEGATMGVKDEMIARNLVRNQAIWKERKEQGTTLSAIAEKYGVTRERVRQIVAKEDRHIELRKQKEGASYGG